MDYNDVTRILTVVNMDGSIWEFSGVPREIYYGMPTGITAILYIRHKLYGRYSFREIPTS